MLSFFLNPFPALYDSEGDGDEGEESDLFTEDSCVDDDDESEDSAWRCPCRYHARHWSRKMNQHRTHLRHLVQQSLRSTFKTTPSVLLYQCLLAISHDDAYETEEELLADLSEIATTSSDTFVAALDIHIADSNPDEIANLLDSHGYLLRPRDAPTLQDAVLVMAEDPAYRTQSLRIAEKELNDVVLAIRAAVHASFFKIQEKTHLDEFAEICKLRMSSQARRDRIERWVDAIVTPGTITMHPMAFAAMMMGFPIGHGADGDDADPAGYLDMDGDPDLEDLREEFRPKLKERFEGWTPTTSTMKGGSNILNRVYYKVVELMPFFKAPDFVEEMLSRYVQLFLRPLAHSDGHLHQSRRSPVQNARW